MRRRSLNILLLAFTALWLGVVVPVHTRGSIKLPGTAPSDAMAAEGRSRCHAPSAPADDAPVPSDDKRSCAVCHLIATLDVPPADDLRLRPAGVAEQLGAAPDITAPSVDYPLPILGRAPPIT